MSRTMIFTRMPLSATQALTYAKELAPKLTSVASQGLKPLVVLEPVTDSGGIDFSAYRYGKYDGLLNSYFESLKQQGINSGTLGMWVYFPEADIPQWGAVDIADYGPNVVRSVNIQKRQFPGSQASIMLDAMSYPAGSTSWDDGRYVSLTPFVSGIPFGLLDSFGLQGFPWVPPANAPGSANLNPAQYLKSALAAEAAVKLGVKSIWLNTGTFAAMYTAANAQTVTMDTSQRKSLLNGVNQQALNLVRAGFSVSVNVFAENKSNSPEATDWSYSSPAAQAVLTEFMAKLKSENIGFWLFDP